MAATSDIPLPYTTIVREYFANDVILMLSQNIDESRDAAHAQWISSANGQMSGGLEYYALDGGRARPFIERTDGMDLMVWTLASKLDRLALAQFSPDQAVPDVDTLSAVLKANWISTWPGWSPL